MRKIPSVFQRNPDDMRHVLSEVTPGCEWVLAGEGVATRMYDGVCVMLDQSGWWARREVEAGEETPADFRYVGTDLLIGNTVGWESIERSRFWLPFIEAFRDDFRADGIQGGFAWGTYELIGPEINGNPESYGRHVLHRHADAERLLEVEGPRLAEHIRLTVMWQGELGWEGIVWHHPDGRMAKLEARDFR